MLGIHPKLRRDLEKHGLRAFAKVREAKMTHLTEATGNAPADLVQSQKNLWKLVLQVEPEGEEPFEVRLEEWHSSQDKIEPSERHYQFVVLYDPGDHSRVVIDHSDEAARMLMVNRVKEKDAARVKRMRERGQNFWADRVEAAQDSMADYLSEDRSDLSADEREDALAGQQQKMREIMAGDSAQRAEQIRALQLDASIPPDQKQAKIMELMAGLGAPTAGMVVGGQPVADGPSSDAAKTADALTKLATLHDRGVLTDDEFQAQKHKLLGE
jgi:hypothetical protein